MKLVTDYAQWYDEVFDGEGIEFFRAAFTRGGLSKQRQFELFDRLGLRTPPHGRVIELAAGGSVPPEWKAPVSGWRSEIEAVVYLDELEHAGKGKVKLPLAQAAEEYPDHFASLFVPLVNPAVVLRHARFGRLGFWLRQKGGEDWRSNRADNETVLSVMRHEAPNPLPRVLWAIDFLPATEGLLAVDFNTAPDLTTVGEVKCVSAEEIHGQLIQAAAKAPQTLRQF